MVKWLLLCFSGAFAVYWLSVPNDYLYTLVYERAMYVSQYDITQCQTTAYSQELAHS